MYLLNGFSTCSCLLFGIVLVLLEGKIDSVRPVRIHPHPLSRLSFTEITKCSGTYDKGIYAEMNTICMDCNALYHDREFFDVYRTCR